MKAAASGSQTSQNNSVWSGRPHLINTSDLSKDEVFHLLERAKYFKQQLFGNRSKNSIETLSAILPGRIEANLFYENSTRTRLSFELASKHLGMHVLNLDVNRSSVKKGETLEDTARTLMAMGVDVIVQRHSEPGSAQRLAAVTGDKVHIINAGEGKTDHPTQALLDLFTMLEINSAIEKTDLQGQKIVIVGDVIHSRVARANFKLMPLFGAEIHVVGPKQLMPKDTNKNKIIVHNDLDDALKNADFIMAIRPQFERQEEGVFGSVEKYVEHYQINHERLKQAKPSAKVYAPGPINRDIEISSKVADDENFALIEKQVQNGVPIRMAVLEALCKTN
jgi:aspartate carbamoyltransferase catalytic subunit